MVFVNLALILSNYNSINLFHNVSFVIKTMLIVRPELVQEFLLKLKFLMCEFDIFFNVIIGFSFSERLLCLFRKA